MLGRLDYDTLGSRVSANSSAGTPNRHAFYAVQRRPHRYAFNRFTGQREPCLRRNGRTSSSRCLPLPQTRARADGAANFASRPPTGGRTSALGGSGPKPLPAPSGSRNLPPVSRRREKRYIMPHAERRAALRLHLALVGSAVTLLRRARARLPTLVISASSQRCGHSDGFQRGSPCSHGHASAPHPRARAVGGVPRVSFVAGLAVRPASGLRVLSPLQPFIPHDPLVRREGVPPSAQLRHLALVLAMPCKLTLSSRCRGRGQARPALAAPIFTASGCRHPRSLLVAMALRRSSTLAGRLFLAFVTGVPRAGGARRLRLHVAAESVLPWGAGAAPGGELTCERRDDLEATQGVRRRLHGRPDGRLRADYVLDTSLSSPTPSSRAADTGAPESLRAADYGRPPLPVGRRRA